MWDRIMSMTNNASGMCVCVCVVRKSRDLSWGGKTERVAVNYRTAQHAFTVESNQLFTCEQHASVLTLKQTLLILFIKAQVNIQKSQCDLVF